MSQSQEAPPSQEVQLPVETKNDSNNDQDPCCTVDGLRCFFSWVAAPVGLGFFVTGSIFLAIVSNGISSGYSEANCSTIISGGHLNGDYCGNCDKCKCKKTCCDYDIMVTPLTGSPPFNRSMRKRSCSTRSPCNDWYGQLQGQVGSSTPSGSKSFSCLYKDYTPFCMDEVGFCDVITLPEHVQLVDYGKYLQRLLPFWIVLVVLGVIALPVLPLRIVFVGPCPRKP